MNDTPLFTWVIIPLFIFVARVFDVSLGTLRIIFTSRGRRKLSPILGFLEVLIWLLAIGQIFKNLNNVLCYLAYAGGFAAGTFVGIYFENKLAIGIQVVRIITHRDATDLTNKLKEKGYGLTVFDGEGATGAVKLIFLMIKRKNLPQLLDLIKKFNPRAFYSVEDVRFAREGVYPEELGAPRTGTFGFLNYIRKGK